jgi:hypothetical protein
MAYTSKYNSGLAISIQSSYSRVLFANKSLGALPTALRVVEISISTYRK